MGMFLGIAQNVMVVVNVNDAEIIFIEENPEDKNELTVEIQIGKKRYEGFVVRKR